MSHLTEYAKSDNGREDLRWLIDRVLNFVIELKTPPSQKSVDPAVRDAMGAEGMLTSRSDRDAKASGGRRALDCRTS